jgi:hypothetical protein
MAGRARAAQLDERLVLQRRYGRRGGYRRHALGIGTLVRALERGVDNPSIE